MKLKILLILLLLLPFAFAVEYNHYNLEELKTLYNQNLEKVPGIVKSLIGNEIINLYYTSAGKTITVGIRTHKAVIIAVKDIPYEEPTMNIYVSEETVQAIREGKITIQQALKTGRIKYESLKFKTKFKMALAKPALKIWGWFA